MEVMDNINLLILDEIIGEKETFKIDDNKKAEWAIKKIKEETIDAENYIKICESVINEYKIKIEERKKKLKNETEYFKNMLHEYFKTVKKKELKTKHTYELPAGALELNFKEPDYKRDEKKLIPWLKENNLKEFVKVEEKTDWAGLKKKIKVSGTNAIDENGEVIPGIEIKEKAPEFIVKI
jgi:hypothetical protein